ncbi:MAG: TolC family protein [Verrucomicrobiae bacterium]|nr:TolC family protein [Verrucomicrobiae bacterium]
MKTFVRLLLVVPLCAVGSDLPQPPLTLPRAIELALANHPEARLARQRIEAAHARAIQSRLWPNPELELSADDIPTDHGGLSEAKLMAGISQTIPFPGKKPLDSRIAQQDIHIAEAEARQRERELIRDVTIAFYTVLAAEKKVTVANDLVALAQTVTLAIRDRVATGAAATPELLRAEIELERARVEAAAVQRDLLEARRTLARLIAQPVAEVTGELPETPAGAIPHPAHPVGTEHRAVPEIPDSSHASFASHQVNPRLAAAAAQRQRAELELRRARLEPWPDITIGVAAGRDEATEETMMEFRIAVPLPIFDRAQGRRRETRALAEIARLEVDNTAQQLAQDRDIALARLHTAQAQADTYRHRILPKADEALRMVRQGYEAGKFSLLDLLDTQRTAFEARLAYYDTLLELNTAAADLAALADHPNLGRYGPPRRPPSPADAALGGRALPNHSENQP